MDRDRAPTAFLGGPVSELDDVPTLPSPPSTISHVRLAISPARRPAFADSSTISRLRVGLTRAFGEGEQFAKVGSESTFA